MTVPPDEDRSQHPSSEPVHAEAPPDFDPYRFGRPEHPVPPEYAPPGYVPPPVASAPPPPTWPPPAGAYPPPHYPYPPGPPAAYRPGSNTKAVLSLVFGILALLLFWTTLWDALLIVPAIVLGALGRTDARRFPERGHRAMATSGLVCGIVAAVLALVSTVYIYNRVKPCLDQFEPTSSSFQQCATDRLLGR
jgi:hypothetical protein